MSAPRPRPLDRATLERALARVGERVWRLELRDEVDSTSDILAGYRLPADGRAALCIAERQRAGRGRRGRAWHAPAGGAILFSLARAFDAAPAALGALGLAAGVAAGETLRAHGIAGIGVKWPNDLQADGAKLGGILVELSGGPVGPSRAIVGIGVNYDLGAGGGTLDQPTTDVTRAAARPPPRPALAGALMAALVDELDLFAAAGVDGLRARWPALDVLAGRPVRVETARGAVLTGTARGIADDGGLVVATDAGERTLHAGEVSVRMAG